MGVPKLQSNPLPNGFEFVVIIEGREHVIGIRSFSEPKEMLAIRRAFDQINEITSSNIIEDELVWVGLNSVSNKAHIVESCGIAKQRRKPEIRIPVSKKIALGIGMELCGVCVPN